MTNQEAIEILKVERNHMMPTLFPERIEAIDMAISALQEQELERSLGTMSAIKRHMEEEVEKIANEYGYPLDLVMDAVNYAEFDLARVELMMKARVLTMYIHCKQKQESLEEDLEIEKDFNSRLKEENHRLESERGYC